MDFFPAEESTQSIFYGVTNGIYQDGHHPLPTNSAVSSARPQPHHHNLFNEYPSELVKDTEDWMALSLHKGCNLCP